MTWLWLVLEIAIEGFAAWTLAVHLCMAMGAAAVVSWPLFAIGMAGFQYLGRERWSAVLRAGRGERNEALLVVAVGLGFSIPALLWVTPSADDFNFFHRAIWQATRLAEPFTTADTAFSAQGLQAISPLHTLTTWELGSAMTARALGLDPLGVYQNGTPIATSLLLACLFAVWLRELGYGAAAALAGVVAVFGFFGVDDPSFRSYGIAWRMLWVGKMVQWLLLFPLALLFAWRYLRDENSQAGLRSWVHPLCCGVAAVGLSGTGVFLLPGVFAAASLAAFAAGPLRWKRLLHCGSLNFASLYCFAIAGLLFSGLLPQPSDMSAWKESFPAYWLDSLFLVFGHSSGMLRAAFLALAVPALVLRGAERRFLILYGLALIAVFANPIAGPLWIEAAQPGSYWRVALLFPVSLGVAIVAAALWQSFVASRATTPEGPTRAVVVGTAVAAVACFALARAAEPRPQTRMQHEYGTKSPFALRLPAAHLRFLAPVRNELAGRRLLAAPGISTSAALWVPTLRIDAARLKDTRHVFANAGRAREGEQRIAAWQWAGACTPQPLGARAAASLLAEGTNALILRDCPRGGRVEVERSRVLSQAAGRWLEVARSDGFVLYLRD